MTKAGTVSRGIVYPAVVRLVFLGLADEERPGRQALLRTGLAGEVSCVRSGFVMVSFVTDWQERKGWPWMGIEWLGR